MKLVPRDNGYHAKSKAIGTDVYIGGERPDQFEAIIKSVFHGGEFNLELIHIDSPVTGRTDAHIDGKVIHNAGDFKHEFKPGNELIEWDMLFPPGLAPPIIRFRIKASKGITFLRTEITQNDIDMFAAAGMGQPQYTTYDAPGSFAVYIDRNGKKYGHGKVAHIYSPYYIDEDGNRSPLLDMNITPDGDNAKMLILTDTQAVTDWKDDPIRAGHLLRLDPTIGYDVQGALTVPFSGSAGYVIHPLQATTDAIGGEISAIHAYISNADSKGVKMAVANCDQVTFNPTGLTVVAQGATVSTPGLGVEKVTVIPGGSLLPNTKYQLGIVFDGAAPLLHYDSALPPIRDAYTYVATFANELVSPVPATTPSGTTGLRYSLWAEYEPAAPGDGKTKSAQVVPVGVKKSFSARGSQLSKPPGTKGAFK